jgi:1,4-alpha-glucan branching enzyme
LDWALESWGSHAGVRQLVTDLNRLYRSEPALHVQDFLPGGFEWLDCHDADRTILSFLRWAPDWDDLAVVAANFTPVYGGHGAIVPSVLDAQAGVLHGRDQYIELPLPGLSLVVLKPER